jgi:hypothetical protein
MGALVFALACTPSGRQGGEPRPGLHPTDTSAPESSALGPAEAQSSGQFLVEAQAGELVLQSLDATSVRVLAGAAQGALYDPRLELVWFDTSDRLWVLDLRTPASSPVLIAEHVPFPSELRVVQSREQRLEPADGCGTAPALKLSWSARPSLEAGPGPNTAPAPTLTPEGTSWLVRELGRTERVVAAPLRFSGPDPDVPRPETGRTCEDATCGATLPFGTRSWQLVVVETSVRAGCSRAACLLREAKTGGYATPPEADHFGPALGAQPGPCGPYLFNQDGSSFLVGDVACSPQRGCQKLQGQALGWILPGVTLGTSDGR